MAERTTYRCPFKHGICDNSCAWYDGNEKWRCGCLVLLRNIGTELRMIREKLEQPRR